MSVVGQTSGLRCDCGRAPHLVHLVPSGVQVLLDHVTLEGVLSDRDLGVGVTLALPQAPHQVVLGNQALRLQQVQPQHPLQATTWKCTTVNARQGIVDK